MSGGRTRAATPDALEVLLVEQVTQGLSRAQRAELDILRREAWGQEPGAEADRLDAASLERAATAVDFAFALESIPAGATRIDCQPPADLDRRLTMLAANFTATAAAGTGDVEPAAVLDFKRPGDESSIPEFASSRSSRTSSLQVSQAAPATSRAGWWLAAAAAALAAVGWWPRIAQGPTAQEQVATEVPAAPPASAIVSPVSEPAIVVALAATEDPAGVGASGAAEWSSLSQQGVLRITGLAVNDPEQFQYQLWIFDREQDERYPIDGGVFDVTGTGETLIVAINAKIQVREPHLFAITVEKPGGAVVSNRERIVLAGAVA